MSDPTPTLAAVRILHTSDWHLGRTFHGESLIDEQRQAVERIVALAAEMLRLGTSGTAIKETLGPEASRVAAAPALPPL